MECCYQVTRSVERYALRANLVERAESWPWSSLGGPGRDDWPPLLSGRAWLRPIPWLEFFNRARSEAELAAIRHSQQRGSPLGDADWITSTAQALERKSTLRPRARPKREAKGIS